ncbi:MAG: glucose-6-phosphate isomerase [Gemmatimonadetes bacterium]|nr:glucose-6-phosphate isomerase [Gemmatimonadota bacterium]
MTDAGRNAEIAPEELLRLDLANLPVPIRRPDGSDGRTAERPEDDFRAALTGIGRRRAEGELAFLDLVHDRDLVEEVKRTADRRSYEDVIVFGIGGSALGTRALRDAILGPAWNADARNRRGLPRLHVVDNPDPDTVGSLLARVDPAKTLYNVVSKSGRTTETLALYLTATESIARALGSRATADRLVFTTSPDSGPLRRIARDEGIATFSIPTGVGGRFSALSAVGILPLALAGADIDALLDGAAQMAERCRKTSLKRNPAGRLAVSLVRAERISGRRIVVFMPYGDRLTACGRFFQQLWAESLGKRPDRGPTPLAASGPADQHSLLQLLADGPADKVVVFLEAGGKAKPLQVPDRHVGIPELARLAGRSLHDILAIERRATAQALARSGCPNATVALAAPDERSLGAFLMLVQLATVMAAELYGVDPFGQPGVEGTKALVARYLEG